tara:strand:+ start:812 stop:1267 length:456 start_codon:yes stop_codon:yes gene_type:complete
MDWFIVFLATKLHVAIVLAAFAVFIYASRKQKVEFIKVSLITLPLAFIVSRIANFLIENPRPFVDGHMIALIEHAPDNGFPSEHTLLAVTVGTIVYTENRLAGSVLIMLGVLVGTGRVLAGVHHTIDILGSTAIAFAATYLTVLMLRRWQP